MPPSPDASITDAHQPYVPLLRLWILRLLLKCNGVDRFLRETRFAEASVAELLGFDLLEQADYTPAWALQALTQKLQALEALAPQVPREQPVARNLARLAERLGLSPVETDILHFAVIQRVQPVLSETLELVGDLVRASLVRLLSLCLGHAEDDVQAALRDSGRLCRTALLSVDDSQRYTFGCKVDLLPGLAEAMTLQSQDLHDLFAASFTPAGPAELSLADFPHLAPDAAVLRPYLASAMGGGGRGVNVLLHGLPGTGKTEFAKALAAAAGAHLMVVPIESADGRPRGGKDRFESLRFAQSLLAGSGPHVLLFDEVEDVFHATRSSSRLRGNSSGIKGWVNALLESNPVPVIWITNCLDHLDAAYLRRFDYVLKIEPPPASVRRVILDRALGDAPISEGWRRAAAAHESMTAASLRRAVRVAVAAGDVDVGLDLEQALSRSLAGTLEAMGEAPLVRGDASDLDDYHLAWLNADVDLEALATGLTNQGSGRVCLWGPPGTGKSAFGRHVAQRIGRPCLVRRASDILSPYVGVAERNIAQMFRQARAESAVLVLDEADSFLRSRQASRHSWEVTQVNEMLTAMESFEGVFIASTNLMAMVDEAAMRRFDVCARLTYLSETQVRHVMLATCEALRVTATPAAIDQVVGLRCLTPGDFAAARRGLRLAGAPSAQALAQALARLTEGRARGASARIGFV